MYGQRRGAGDHHNIRSTILLVYSQMTAVSRALPPLSQHDREMREKESWGLNHVASVRIGGCGLLGGGK